MAPADRDARRYADEWTATQSCDARDLARVMLAKLAMNVGLDDVTMALGLGLSRRSWYRLKRRVRELERAGRG